MNESTDTVKNTHEDQKASVNSAPSTVESHKHPEMTPANGKCNQGANIK